MIRADERSGAGRARRSLHDHAATGCIDENDIAALFDHRLSKAEVDAIDDHVEGCAACRDLLSRLARLYASSSPSRALVQTVALLDLQGMSRDVAVPEANVKRLLAVLSCERRIGTVLCGKWRLDCVLGVGGMAEVYAATHLSNGRRAAIKCNRCVRRRPSAEAPEAALSRA